MSLRRPTEEEHEYIRKHVRAHERGAIFLLVIFILCIAGAIALCEIVIFTQHKGIGFIIMSVIVQLVLLLIALGFGVLIKDSARLIRLAAEERYEVQNCSVVSKQVRREGKHTKVVLTVEKDNGMQMQVKGTSVAGKSIDKGERMLLVFFEQPEEGKGSVEPVIYRAKDIYKNEIQ